MSCPHQTLHPVIQAVPQAVQAARRREKVRALSRIAREAVRRSAERSGLQVPDFQKDDRGAPIPSGGVFWSLSHKPRYVAGIVASGPVGIDIEEMRERNEALFRKIAGSTERRMLEDSRDPLLGFHRCWTAKEAVLKAAGVGLIRLSACRIQSIPNATQTVVRLDDKLWTVAHHRFDGHLAAVVSGACAVVWTVVEETGV